MSDNLLKYLPKPEENKDSLLKFLPGNAEATQIRANVFASTPIPPDLATKQYNLSKQSNIPIQAVRTRENEIMQRTEFDSLNYDDIANNFPKVAKQLLDNSKTGAIRDDISNLSYFEKVTRDTKQQYQASQLNVEASDAGLKRMFFEVGGNEKNRLSPLEQNKLDLLNSQETVDYDLGFISSIPGYTAQAIPTMLDVIPQTIAGTAAGAGIGAGVGSVIPGVGTAAGAITGAAWGSRFGTAYGIAKQETAAAYNDLRELSSLTDGRVQNIEPSVAAGAAMVTGVINGAIELIPFGEATGQLKKALVKQPIKKLIKEELGKELFKNIGRLALAEGAAEGLQELSGIVFKEAAKAVSAGNYALIGMKDGSDVEGLIGFISESADAIWESSKAGFGAGIGLGTVTGGTGAANQIRQRRKAGKEEEKQIADVVGKIKESKVFGRDPALFKDVTEETLGSRSIYMPAEDVQTFFQDKTPEEIQKINEAMPELKDQLAEATELGGNIVIPANSALTAMAQYPELGEMQKMMSFTPESFKDLEAQDAFLQDVVPAVAFEEKTKEAQTRQDVIKKNIEKQVLNLGMPYRDAKDLITTIKSFYETKLERYNNQDAEQILNSYLGSLELQNAPLESTQNKPQFKIEDLDLQIDKARKPQKVQKTGKPLMGYLKKQGGVKIGSPLAEELNVMGVNTSTAPALFRKDTGLSDLDNIPSTEFAEIFPDANFKDDSGYVDRQAMLDAIQSESKGEDTTQTLDEGQSFADQLNEIGVDINDATNEEIKEAIKEYQETAETSQEPVADTNESKVTVEELEKPEPEFKPKVKPEPIKIENPIEDFGEKIHGAKKDAWNDYRDILDEALPEDLKKITLAKYFPEPNYDVLIANGADIKVLAAIKAIRDEVPSKPRVSYKLKRWAGQVESVRGLANDLLSGNLEVGELLTKLNNLDSKFGERIELYSKLGYPAFTNAKDWSIGKGSYSVYNQVRYSPAKTLFSVRKGRDFGKQFETYPEALSYLQEVLSVKPDPQKKVTKLDIYQIIKTGEIVIGKKTGTRKYLYLKGGFTGVKEARAFLKENEQSLQELLVKKKEVAPTRKETNAPRVGEDHRMGENIAPERFASEFGFRGVQFGNYVEQVKRAEDLNNSYDALLDLADIINVPSQAISLNGELGLAFGARGKGGKRAAKAHYETENTVINLTKNNGAGSLGHEWWHALDNFFGKKQGDDFITEKPRIKKVVKGDELVDSDAVRPEVAAAYKEVMKAIKESELPKRSRELDNKRAKDYWSTDIEMSARAFETYIISKAKEKGYSNDYLANVLDEKVSDVSNKMAADLGMEKEPYAYPTEAEMKPINAAFDKLFETLQTKKTDKGTTFYQSPVDQTETQEFKKWAGGDNVDVVESDEINSYDFENDKPVVVKVFHGTTHNFNEFDATRGNLESQFGAVNYFTSSFNDAENNYKGEGLDLTQRIEQKKERLDQDLEDFAGNQDSLQELVETYKITEEQAQEVIDGNVEDVSRIIAAKELRGDTDQVLELYVKMKKPFVVGEDSQWINIIDNEEIENQSIERVAKNNDITVEEVKENRDEYEDQIDEARWEVEEEIGNPLVDAINNVASRNDIDASNLASQVYDLGGEASAANIEKLMRESEDFIYAENQEDGGLIGFDLLSQVIEEMGYDSIILKNASERFSNMNIDPGTAHVHIFDSGKTNIKSVDNKGTFDPENANIYYQDGKAPAFYSALEDQITNIQQKKGSPEQWAGIIKNLTQKGVKKEELDWTGIEEWLKEQEGSVTKEQILDYLQANKIEVEEVVKGENERTLLQKRVSELNDRYDDLTEDEQLELKRLSNQLDQVDNKSTGDAKFSKYVLAGGENYRELLMTLPVKGNSITVAEKEELEVLQKRQNNEADFPQKDHDRYKALMQKSRDSFDNKSQYRSSHFDEANILAHIRFNERTDKDGKSVMFIEEVQSDWHQEGRKKGYKDEEFNKIAKEQDNIKSQIKDTKKQINDEIKRVNYKGFDSENEASQAFIDAASRREDFAKMFELPASIENLVNKYVELDKSLISEGNNVPDAPFKTTWDQLAIKRALLWAVENKFDKIAWTTGEQQADRFDLSKQIKSVSARKTGDEYQIQFVTNQGTKQTVNGNDYINIQTVEDNIGKELAAKIEKQEPSKEFTEYSGLDLKVGGEGMKAFYDKMLPSMVNKLAKKFGGKVDTTEIDIASGEVKDYGYSTLEAKNRFLETHSLEITPAMRESIQQKGLPLFQGKEKAPRGQTQFIGQKPIVTLFEGKDRSTVLHELGHVFLQIEKDIATLPGVSEQIKEDWATLENWLEIKDGVVTTEAHEKFARGFESYLREGNAPTVALRDAFRRFKAWLTRIYKNALDLDVKLTNDIRDVFDRMLATDEAIENLKDNPIFRTDEGIMELLTATEKKDYEKITINAGEKAKEQLLDKALKQKARETKKFYQEERARVKAEVEEEMNKNPTFRVIHFLKTGKLLGTETPEGLIGYKIDRADLKANYDAEIIKYLPKGIIGKDGVPPAKVAEDFGFQDAGQMLFSIANSPNFKKELNDATDAEMVRRYGDMLVDGTIEEEAINASENEARANKIIYELNAAGRKVTTYIETKEAYKQKAKEIIADKQVKDATQTNTFYLNEIKAAREAGKALGQKDYEKVVEWKKKQLLNHYLYRESLNLKLEVQKAVKSYSRIKKAPKVGKVTIDEDYRLKAVNLLEDFNLAKKNEDYVKTDVSALELWKNEQTENGALGLVEFPEIAQFQDKDNIRNLTSTEFRTLDDAIKNLIHVGRASRTVVVDGKKIEIDKIATEIKETIEASLRKRPVVRGNLSVKQKAGEVFDSFFDPLDKAADTALKLDGEKDFGPFYNNFVKPVVEGEIKRNEMMEDVYKKIDTIQRKYFGERHLGINVGEISGKKIYIPEVDFSYSKQDMIAFALNWGNETNRRRIRDGFNYTDAQVNTILSNLTENDWGFVRDMWKLIGSYFGEVSALQKRLIGFAPKEVGKKPFKIQSADGKSVELEGGYYPIDYSTQLSEKTTDESLNFTFGSSNSSINFEKSYTKGRTDRKVSKEINLTLRPAFKHLADVINDLALKEQVWNSSKILNNPKVKDAINSRAGNSTFGQLDIWLKDIFGSGLMGADAYSRVVSSLRTGFTVSVLGFKVATSFMQLSGFSHSTVVLGYKYMGIGLLKAIGNGNPAQMNKNFANVMKKSKIMRDRSKTFHRDVMDALKAMEGKGKIAKNMVAANFYSISKMQMLVDVPTWLGGYEKGLKEFNGNEAKAIDFADAMVTKAQGTGLGSNLSSLERGTAFGARQSALVKMIVPFFTYFNAKYNIMKGSYRRTDFSKPRDVARFSSDMLLLFLIETLVGEALVRRMPDFEDEDDKAGAMAMYSLKLIAQTFAAQIPFARDATSALQGFHAAPTAYTGGEKIAKGVVGFGAELYKLTPSSDEDFSASQALEELNNFTGILFKYGSAQLDIVIDASQKAAKGEEVAPIDYFIKNYKK